MIKYSWVLLFIIWAGVTVPYVIYQNLKLDGSVKTLIVFLLITSPILLLSNLFWILAFNRGVVSNSPIALIMSAQFLIYNVGMLLGGLFIGHRTTSYQLIGLVVVSVGVYITSLK